MGPEDMSTPLPAISLKPDHNDPGVTKAFIAIAARIQQVLNRAGPRNNEFVPAPNSPFATDLDWIKNHIVEPYGDVDLLLEFSNYVTNQGQRARMAADNVSAMKILARRMTKGFEAASSLARAISVCATSIRYAIDPSETSEVRVTRFAAGLVAQANYARRAQFGMQIIKSESGSRPNGRTQNIADPEAICSLLEAVGFSISRIKRQDNRPRTVMHGDVQSAINWNASSESKKIDDLSHFGWLLTSGVAHAEPWATENFNEGSVDFYATMAKAILVPSTVSIIKDLGSYLGYPTDREIKQLETAEIAFGETIEPIFVRAMERLPEDDPRRVQYNARIFEEIATFENEILSLYTSFCESTDRALKIRDNPGSK